MPQTYAEVNLFRVDENMQRIIARFLRSIVTNANQLKIRARQMDKRAVRKFLLISGAITGVYLVIATFVAMSAIAEINNPHQTPPPARVQPSIPQGPAGATVIRLPHEGDVEEEISVMQTHSRTNVLVVGRDNEPGGLADTIFVVSFDRNSGALHILNIPRDTFVELTPERVQCMLNAGVRAGFPTQMKMNALVVWGRQYGMHYMREQLSEDLGIEIHHFVEFDLVAFRSVVDLVGGVEMDIPIRLYYRDPFQRPPVVINIPPGVHLLDGNMAEQVIRYRETLPGSDLARVNIQQQFKMQLFRQVLSRETLMNPNNLIGLAGIAINYVETDFTIIDATLHLQYLNLLSPERIFTYTLPGRERRTALGSTWVPDIYEVPVLINRVFFDIYEEYERPQDRPSHGLRIAVYNGTAFSGLGFEFGDRLAMDGYNIVHTGNFVGQQRNQTRIVVREEGVGQDLLEYFYNVDIQVDPQLNENYDIMIIIGRSMHFR